MEYIPFSGKCNGFLVISNSRQAAYMAKIDRDQKIPLSFPS